MYPDSTLSMVLGFCVREVSLHVRTTKRQLLSHVPCNLKNQTQTSDVSFAFWVTVDVSLGLAYIMSILYSSSRFVTRLPQRFRSPFPLNTRLVIETYFQLTVQASSPISGIYPGYSGLSCEYQAVLFVTYNLDNGYTLLLPRISSLLVAMGTV